MWDSATMSTGLMTDLYDPDAAYISWRTGHNEPTTFDLYTRAAPFEGAYLLVAGLELALEFVRRFRYTDGDIAYLRQIRDYDDRFLRELLGLRFSGEVLAMPEGSIAFPHEPLLRVTAPFREALLLESGLLHFISASTLIATRAARIVHAAQGRPVAEFAFRRVQEPFIAARAASIGGCTRGRRSIHSASARPSRGGCWARSTKRCGCRRARPAARARSSWPGTRAPGPGERRSTGSATSSRTSSSSRVSRFQTRASACS